MNFQVRRSAAAQEQSNQLSPSTRKAVKYATRELRNGPHFPGSAPLAGQVIIWRVRLNKRWRLLFELHEAERLIVITRIGLRDNIYDDYPHPHRSG